MEEYLFVLLGIAALAAVILFDPTIRTKVRQMRRHHQVDNDDHPRVSEITAVLSASPETRDQRKHRRKNRRR